MKSPPASAELAQAVAKVRASGVLGEARLKRLFDYLVERSAESTAPKEMSIAMDVFDKQADFDVSQDALVRVYIHKLRRTLEEFYAANPLDSAAHLHLPRGEYRLRLMTQRPPESVPPGTPRNGRPLWWAAGGLLAMLLIGIVFAVAHDPQSELERVRANPIWSALLADDRPILIVVGDYYLIGESDDAMGVNRLIREYSVNSKSDLEHYVAEHPKLAERYMDVGLRYLPIATAFALRDVMVVLAEQNRRVSVIKMSDVEPSNLKSADIVYIGYLSGMGMLQDVVFEHSRFGIGDTYDEVVDKKTRQAFVSEMGSNIMGPPAATGKEKTYRDYGVFEKMRGPGGNIIIMLAGTRDEGVRQTAEVFTSAQKLAELPRDTQLTLPFEALLEVNAVDGVNLSGKVLLQSNRDGTAK